LTLRPKSPHPRLEQSIPKQILHFADQRPHQSRLRFSYISQQFAEHHLLLNNPKPATEKSALFVCPATKNPSRKI
ncbi:hypothetical protein ES288_D03G182000v1, partial [Gossypium darwinii]